MKKIDKQELFERILYDWMFLEILIVCIIVVLYNISVLLSEVSTAQQASVAFGFLVFFSGTGISSILMWITRTILSRKGVI